MSNPEYTSKAKALRPYFYEKGRTDVNLAESLGMSSKSLYKRFKSHEWKESEKVLIDHFIENYDTQNSPGWKVRDF